MNVMAVKFWEQEGLHRVVLARETTKEEIKEIMDQTNVEIEAFVHGAMCIAYSGRCTLSNHMTARDSNRGGCCQSCRWEYDLIKKEDNEMSRLFGEDEIKFAMSPKDLNLLRSVPEMIELGIDSLKIEGRMKSIHARIVKQRLHSLKEFPHTKNRCLIIAMSIQRKSLLVLSLIMMNRPRK